MYFKMSSWQCEQKRVYYIYMYIYIATSYSVRRTQSLAPLRFTRISLLKRLRMRATNLSLLFFFFALPVVTVSSKQRPDYASLYVWHRVMRLTTYEMVDLFFHIMHTHMYELFLCSHKVYCVSFSSLNSFWPTERSFFFFFPPTGKTSKLYFLASQISSLGQGAVNEPCSDSLQTTKEKWTRRRRRHETENAKKWEEKE